MRAHYQYYTSTVLYHTWYGSCASSIPLWHRPCKSINLKHSLLPLGRSSDNIANIIYQVPGIWLQYRELWRISLSTTSSFTASSDCLDTLRVMPRPLRHRICCSVFFLCCGRTGRPSPCRCHQGAAGPGQTCCIAPNKVSVAAINRFVESGVSVRGHTKHVCIAAEMLKHYACLKKCMHVRSIEWFIRPRIATIESSRGTLTTGRGRSIHKVHILHH